MSLTVWCLPDSPHHPLTARTQSGFALSWRNIGLRFGVTSTFLTCGIADDIFPLLRFGPNFSCIQYFCLKILKKAICSNAVWLRFGDNSSSFQSGQKYLILPLPRCLLVQNCGWRHCCRAPKFFLKMKLDIGSCCIQKCRLFQSDGQKNDRTVERNMEHPHSYIWAGKISCNRSGCYWLLTIVLRVSMNSMRRFGGLVCLGDFLICCSTGWEVGMAGLSDGVIAGFLKPHAGLGLRSIFCGSTWALCLCRCCYVLW